MQGFYLLAVRRQRRHKWILLAACIAALLSLFFAIRHNNQTTQPVAPAETPVAPYLVSSDNGTVIVTKAGKMVWRTEIDERSLPKADREELARGIALPDETALAHLLEDYDA